MVLLHYQSPLSSISNHQPSSHVLSELDLRSMSSPTTASAHFLQLHSENKPCMLEVHISIVQVHVRWGHLEVVKVLVKSGAAIEER